MSNLTILQEGIQVIRKFFCASLLLTAMVQAQPVEIPTEQECIDQGLWGIHTTVDLHGCDPEAIRSKELIERYVIELCDLIEMSRFGEPIVVNFGREPRVAGYSMFQLIETSNIAGHFANESNTAYIDVFSCKWYDPNIVVEFTKKFFGAEDATVNLMLRK